MAGELANASKFANDRATSGFRDLCLAALASKARGVITNPPAGDDLALAYAKAVFANSIAHQDSVAWAVATDPAIYVQTTALPTEASIITAVATAWPTLSHLNSKT